MNKNNDNKNIVVQINLFLDLMGKKLMALVAHTGKPSTREAETDRSLKFDGQTAHLT